MKVVSKVTGAVIEVQPVPNGKKFYAPNGKELKCNQFYIDKNGRSFSEFEVKPL